MEDAGGHLAGRPTRRRQQCRRDTRNNKRDGRVYLKPLQTVAAGVPFGRPYNAPFAVR
jgi:hypothetical protein